MTYDEAIAFWYGRIDFEKRSAKPDDLKLDRMRALLGLLNDPQKRLRIIHIAGTKGKGSTSAMLASVLKQAGYRVGLFTSPHLQDVSERIQVDNVPISRDEITARVQEIQPAVQFIEKRSTFQSPTFFEVGTAIGFLHFLYRRTDFVILEVGLGGRLDSTNVCLPFVSVITNISYDHMAQLGNSLKEIAREKAGIIKTNRPVISTAKNSEARSVIQQIAQQKKSRLSLIERDFRVVHSKPDSECSFHTKTTIQTSSKTWTDIRLNLFGEHQAENASGVIATIEQLRSFGITIPDRAVYEGLSRVPWPARIEVIRTNPTVILDCAHNDASIRALVKTLHTLKREKSNTRLILALSNDKRLADLLKILVPEIDHFYLTRYGNNPRCTPPEILAEILKQISPNVAYSIHSTAIDAWEIARKQAQTHDMIVISGSVFLAGELRGIIQPQ